MAGVTTDDTDTATSTQAKDTTTVASLIPFMELCAFLEKVQRSRGTDNKKKIFKQFLSKWRAVHRELHVENPTTDSFCDAMRLILPKFDNDRPAYGMKENTLARLYIDILGLGRESPAAQKLLNYRTPTANPKASTGDFAEVSFFVLKNRCPDKGSLTIEAVNHSLDAIARNNALKKRDQIRTTLARLIQTTSALEQKWLIRIMMKELNVGLSHQSVFSTFHPDAEELYNVSTSLGRVCRDLHDPEARLNEIEISLFSPFRPMLADRVALQDVAGKAMSDAPFFFIETKMDGERVQLHKNGQTFKYFSRGSKDYTDSFGGSPVNGKLTPHIAALFRPDVQGCILDGEMIGYSPETKEFMTKASGFDVKTASDQDGLITCYCAFDVLMVNGEIFSNRPLSERVDRLGSIFRPLEGRLMLVERSEARTNEDVLASLNGAIDRREEGIMVKHPSSTYKPDKRKGTGWFKIKPEYIDNLMDDLDLLVVGGYFGVGKHRNLISHFLCAVAVPNSVGAKPTEFHTLCKVGSGYSLKELYDILKKLSSEWKVYDKRSPPANIVLAPGFKEKPDVYIEPEKSIILQVKAAEIIYSDRFKTACTLRFPRVQNVRDDKEWCDCMTTEELKTLRQTAEGKLAVRHATLEIDQHSPKKKRKVPVKPERPASVSARFRAADVTAITKTSGTFEGRELCVVNGNTEFDKTRLERLIVQHGGSLIQNPDLNTYCVIAQKRNIKVNNIISCNLYNVVRVEWLLRCFDEGYFVPWLPSDMISTNPETREMFANYYDCYGDSYTAPVTEQQLYSVFNTVQKKGNLQMLNAEEIAEVELEYFPEDSIYGLFRCCRVYMDVYDRISDTSTKIVNSSLELAAVEMRLYGAILLDTLTDDVTHIIIHSSDLTRVDTFKQMMKSNRRRPHLITDRWHRACLDSGQLVNERLFYP